MRLPMIVASMLLALAACKPVDPGADTPMPVDAQAAAGNAPAKQDAAVPAAKMQPAVLDIGHETFPTCNIEAIDDQHFSGSAIAAKPDGEFTLTGYLLDAETRTIPGQLRLRLVSFADPQAWEAPIDGRVDRPGLPEYLHLGAWALRSGFVQKVSLSGLAPGRYRLEVSVVQGDKARICDQGRELAITP